MHVSFTESTLKDDAKRTLSINLPEVALVTDLPLILILSVYTDFLTLKFGNIQVFEAKYRFFL